MKLRRQIMILAAIVFIDFILGITLVLGLGQELGAGSAGAGITKSAAHHVSAGQEYIDPKVVALTFDDGPNKEYTENLLDGLKKRDVKVSFFLIGECIEGNEEIVKRMEDEGHLIGVHCMEHTDLTKVPVDEALTCLGETAKMVEEITGKKPEYVRPPYGSWNSTLEEKVSSELGMLPVFWSVDSIDWKLKNTSKIVNKVVKETKDGDIILMHDEFSTSIDAAFQIIDNLLANGYTFVTVDELTID